MAWTTMHYAIGMGCAGAIAGTASLICRRGWRFLPLAMTAGGIPLWSPFSDERVSFASMRTGSRQEYAVAVGMLLFTCVFGWGLLPEDVKQTHQTIYEKLAASGIHALK